MSLRSWARKINFRAFKSPDEYWRKRAKFGQINMFFRRQVISADGNGYTMPFMCNPFRENWEMERHRDDSEEFTEGMLTAYDYGHSLESRNHNALLVFDKAFQLLEGRIDVNDKICDIGCASGFYLQQFHDRGFKHLAGVEPVPGLIEYGNKVRPYINFVEGVFGPPQFDVPCDVLTWFGVISRIPYHVGLFQAIDRNVSKYVLIANIQEVTDDFVRDYHYEMGKIGFICIDKRVYSGHETDHAEALEYVPIGQKGADGPLFELGDRETGKDMKRFFRSFFLFRRVEPRPPVGSNGA